MISNRLTDTLASQLAGLALAGIRQEYPNSPAHVLMNGADRRLPRELHPAFYGCFDWHSAVHSHWLLVCLLRYRPDLPEAPAIRAVLDEHLSDAKIHTEAAYFAEPGRRSFERPYGWAWLLKLAEELHDWNDADGRYWSGALRPLTEVIVDLYLDYLPRLTYPIRSGAHSNTAFGLSFALDYAIASGHTDLRDKIIRRSLDYFISDQDCPASWEPGGSDFLSPCLAEADLLRRVLTGPDFAAWLGAFLPDLQVGTPTQLLMPVSVSDRNDGQIVHLDGLNLSRAWSLRGIAGALAPDDSRRGILLSAAERHAAAGLSGIGSGTYAGEHWLGSFALYMFCCAP